MDHLETIPLGSEKVLGRVPLLSPEWERTSLLNPFSDTVPNLQFFRNLSLSMVLLQTILLHNFSDFKELQELGGHKHVFPGQGTSVEKLQLCNPIIPRNVTEMSRESRPNQLQKPVGQCWARFLLLSAESLH